MIPAIVSTIHDIALSQPRIDEAIRILDWYADIERKFADGTYKPVNLPQVDIHFLHESTVSANDGKIAYFGKIGAPKATVTSPGKYLKKFFPDMTDGEIQQLIEAMEDNGKGELRFTSKADQIERVYTNWYDSNTRFYPSIGYTGDMSQDSYNRDGGSCMRLKADHYEECRGIHPVRMYALAKDSCVEIAWVQDADGKTISRAVVNRKTMAHGRIYATNETTVRECRALLQEHGFHSEAYPLEDVVFSGVSGCSKFPFFPYLDNAEGGGSQGYHYIHAEKNGSRDCNGHPYWNVTPVTSRSRATHGADTVDGTCTVIDYRDDEDDEDDEEYFYCSDCNRRTHNDDSHYVESSGDSICQRCYENNYSYCEACESTVPSDDISRVHTRRGREWWVCDSCRDEDYFCCHDCDEWFHNENRREDMDGHDLCEGCTGDWVENTDNKWFPSDEAIVVIDRRGGTDIEHNSYVNDHEVIEVRRTPDPDIDYPTYAKMADTIAVYDNTDRVHGNYVTTTVVDKHGNLFAYDADSIIDADEFLNEYVYHQQADEWRWCPIENRALITARDAAASNSIWVAVANSISTGA